MWELVIGAAMILTAFLFAALRPTRIEQTQCGKCCRVFDSEFVCYPSGERLCQACASRRSLVGWLVRS